MKRRLLIELVGRAPGDEVVMTGVVRDLKLHYGDQLDIAVRTRFPGVWRHNPWLSDPDDGKYEKVLPQEGGQIRLMRQKKEPVHYLLAYHREIERLTGLEVPCRFSKPDLHLSPREKLEPYIDGRYWIVVPGGKTDGTTKMWPDTRWQEAIDCLRPWGLRFVQEGSKKRGCIHPPMRGVFNVVGTTSIRDIIINTYHADGVICGITFPMHIAGALGKPCVVLGGGREEPWWEAYVDDYKAFGPHADPVPTPHRFLTTVGLRSCCAELGCWKRRVRPIHDGNKRYDRSICSQPANVDGQAIAGCQADIPVDAVLNAVMSYYEQGILPPPDRAKGTA